MKTSSSRVVFNRCNYLVGGRRRIGGIESGESTVGLGENIAVAKTTAIGTPGNLTNPTDPLSNGFALPRQNPVLVSRLLLLLLLSYSQ